MAITPFTQPMKQGDLVPYERRLPTRAIAEATKGVVQRDVRNRDAIDQMQQRLESSMGRSEVLDPVMNRYRQQIEQIASDGTYDEDTRQIQQLAREAQEDIGFFQQNQEALNKQLEIIQNLEGVSQLRKRQLKNLATQRAQLTTTEEGRIDPNSLFSPIQFGNEANRFEVAKDAIQGLRERLVGEGMRARPDLGLIEFIEQSGVSTGRMKSAIQSAYESNPGIQNWKENTAKLYQQKNPNKTDKQAREFAQRQLDIMVERVANNRAYLDKDVSRRSAPEGLFGPIGGGSGDISRYSGTINIDELPEGSTQRKEYEQLNSAIIDEQLQKNLTDEEYATYQQIQERIGEEGSWYRWMSTIGENSPIVSKEERMLDDAGILDDVKQAREGAEARMPDLIAPKTISPGEDRERDYQQFSETFRNQVVNNVQSGDIDMIIDNVDASSWWSDLDPDDPAAQEIKKRIIRNSEDIRISSDGQFFELTVGDMPSKVSGWDTAQIEGDNIKINTDNFTRDQMESFTQNLSQDNRAAIMSNWTYRNIPVTTEGVTAPNNENARVKRTTKNRFTVERRENGELRPITIRDAISNLEQTERVSVLINQARDQGFDEIDTLNKFKSALENLQAGTETSATRQLEDLRESPFLLRHKGLAIETANRLQ